MPIIVSLKKGINLSYLNDYLHDSLPTSTEETLYLSATQDYILPGTSISFKPDCDLFCYKCPHANKWHIEAVSYDELFAVGAQTTHIYQTNSYYFFRRSILPDPKRRCVIKTSDYTPADIQAKREALEMEKKFNQLAHKGAKASLIINPPNTNSSAKIQTVLVMKQYAGAALQESFFTNLDINTRLQLCHAIITAYKNQIAENNIVHLDLKPANILYNPAANSWEEAIKIIDFNNSALAGTKASIYGVTHEYASAEHYIDQPILLHSGIDIFSLGRILGKILQAPTLISEKYSYPSTLILISQYAYEDLHLALADMPPEHKSILQSALAKTTHTDSYQRISIDTLLEIFTSILISRNALQTTPLFAIPQRFTPASGSLDMPTSSAADLDENKPLTQFRRLPAPNAS